MITVGTLARVRGSGLVLYNCRPKHPDGGFISGTCVDNNTVVFVADVRETHRRDMYYVIASGAQGWLEEEFIEVF